jgi:hypothetical protein
MSAAAGALDLVDRLLGRACSKGRLGFECLPTSPMRLPSLIFGLVCLSAVLAPPLSAGGDLKIFRPGAGFSVGVPTAWVDLRSNSPEVERALREASAENPALRPLFDALAGSANPLIKFIAVDLGPRTRATGFATNLNVVRETTRLSLRTYAAASVAALRQQVPTLKGRVAQRSTRLPAGQATELRWSYVLQAGGRARGVAVTQYLLKERSAAYILTYTTLSSQTASYRTSFLQSARSFRFTG